MISTILRAGVGRPNRRGGEGGGEQGGGIRRGGVGRGIRPYLQPWGAGDGVCLRGAGAGAGGGITGGGGAGVTWVRVTLDHGGGGMYITKLS